MDKVNSVAELIERTQHMPLEKMRFFINEDRREPKCFGIYQEADTGHWVVYKNKADGSRAVRYSGPDEAFAAQELWAKINSEIELRRAKRAPRKRKKTREDMIMTAIAGFLIAAVAATGLFFLVRWISRQPSRGYYLIDHVLYYSQADDWYWYDDGEWLYYDDSIAYDDWHDAEYYGESYPYFAEEADAFEQTDYYIDPSDDDDSDSDSDVFDSWDAGDTDWDTDW